MSFVTELVATILSHPNKELSLQAINGQLGKQHSPVRISLAKGKIKALSIDPSINIKEAQISVSYGKIHIKSVILPISVTMSASYLSYVVYIAGQFGIL